MLANIYIFLRFSLNVFCVFLLCHSLCYVCRASCIIEKRQQTKSQEKSGAITKKTATKLKFFVFNISFRLCYSLPPIFLFSRHFFPAVFRLCHTAIVELSMWLMCSVWPYLLLHQVDARAHIRGAIVMRDETQVLLPALCEWDSCAYICV